MLDTGALVALDRGDRAMWTNLGRAGRRNVPVLVPAGALAQAWRRGGPRQARLSRALAQCQPASFDEVARAAGELCGRAGTDAVIDASIALVAARPGTRALYTSDPGDLALLLEAAGPLRPRGIAV